MKIKLISILLCLTFILSLCACDSDDSGMNITNESKYRNDVSSDLIAYALAEAINSPIGFESPDSDYVEFNMEGASALCEDYCIMLSKININMNEFGVFRAKSEADAEALAAICQTYVDLKIEGYNPHYLPDEYPKIQNGRVTTYGCYVIYSFLTTQDTSKIDGVVTEKIAKE